MGIKKRIYDIIDRKCNGSNTVFADRLGISLSIIQKWDDEHLPSGTILQRIYDEFDVDITWLLKGRRDHYLKDIGNEVREPGVAYGTMSDLKKEELALIRTLRFCGEEYSHRMFVAVTVHAQRILDEKKIEKNEKLSVQHDLEMISTATLK